MSDHVPFDVQLEIIQKLPVKSLTRFRSVSKPWKSLIDSSEFIFDYSIRHTQRQHLLIRHYVDDNYKYVSIVDDDTFPMQKNSLTVPENSELLVEGGSLIVGSSYGLFCVFGYDFNPGDSVAHLAVIWNPLLRKSVTIRTPNVVVSFSRCVSFFGVCPNTSDPKIVKLNKFHMEMNIDNLTCSNWEVEVFTLSSRVWRRPYFDLPKSWYHKMLYNDSIVIDGFIYWTAFKCISNRGDGYNVIMSFDLTREEFKEIYLPDKLANDIDSLKYKLRESLAMVKCKIMAEKQVYKVWLMDNGVSKSFTKLLKIGIPHVDIRKLLWFKKNSQLILNMKDYGLVVYDTCTEQIKDLDVYGRQCLIERSFVSSYTESLLLLDQSVYTVVGHKDDEDNASCEDRKKRVGFYLVPIFISLCFFILLYAAYLVYRISI